MHSGKKVLCFALAVSMSVPLMLAGCQKSASSTPSGSSAATSTKKPNVTLEMYTGDKPIQGAPRVTKAINEYLDKQNTGIQIDWHTFSWGDLGNKLNTMLQTGQEADVVNTASWIGNGYLQWSNKGYLTDLTKYVTDAASKDVIDIIGKDFLDCTRIAGKYYGMPTNKEKAHNWGLILQTKEMNKLGIDKTSIKSLADIAKYFDAAKKDGYIPLCGAQMDCPYKFLDWDVVSDDGVPGAFDPAEEATVVDQFIAPKTVEFYKQMKEYNTKGYVSKNVSTASSEETEMKTGQYFCGSWSLMPGKDKTESISLGLDLTQIDITPIEKSNRETLGALLAIPKTSKNPDLAFDFIKRLYTDTELVNYFVWGVEGTDYTKKDEKTIKVNGKTDFQSAGGWIMGNEFNNYLSDTQSPTLYKDIEGYNAKAKPLTSVGFVFDPSSVSDQYTACQNTIKTYYPQLFWGTCKDVDTTVAALKKELTKDGEPALIAAMQKQYDAWKAAK